MILRRTFAAVAAASLLSASTSPTAPVPWGIVTQADKAHLGEAAASVGSTVYHGDRLSTEAGGTLRVAAGGVTLQLDSGSSLIVSRSAAPTNDISGELASGTVVFSAAPMLNVTIIAEDAYIRPAANVRTIAHVRVVNHKELRISADRGPVEFSYHGEARIINEGKAYRVLLDPSERESAALGSGQNTNAPTKPPRKFLFIAIGMAAGITVFAVMHALESPDRP